ncbi:MAG: YitT family protein [Chloroflexi bacterium]|nr:YitT family protein [Chloroflexota bacterium]
MLQTTSPARIAFLRDAILIMLGCVLQALAVVIFLNPADLASGGITGLAIILNRVLPAPIPIGIVTLMLNLPLFAIGLKYLGGWKFLARTIFTTVLYSILVAAFEELKLAPVTNDIILNTLVGSVLGGFGMGMVFLARATTGGTDILALLLVRWRSIPLSQSYIFTDALVIALAGLVFGWEKALYALIALYVTGVAAEAVSEGAHVSRIAFIITNSPDTVSAAIIDQMGRGLTRWTGRGGFTSQERPVLFVVISRAETATLKAIVSHADPQAFVVIGQAQEVYGEGFRQFEKRSG